MASRYSLLEDVKKMKYTEWFLLAVAMLIPWAGGFVGGRLFGGDMYKGDKILRPSWSPPSWLFGPVWTVLFLSMGAASFLVYKCGNGLNRDTVPPLVVYAVKLIALFTWTPLFFGFGLAGVALFDIGVAWALAIACVVSFMPVTRVGAALLVPYVAWLTFASTLNYEIVRLNGAVLHPMHNTTSG